MRILLVNTLYPTSKHPKTIGGAERSVKNIAESLVGIGHEVQVIRAAPPGADYTAEAVNGVVVHALPIRNIYWPHGDRKPGKLARLVWHLLDDWAPISGRASKLLRDFRPDVMHTNNLTALGTGFWSAAAKRHIPIVHTLRDYSLLCPRSMLFKSGKQCQSLCGDCALLTVRRRAQTKLCDAVVGNSVATLNLHLKDGLFDNAKIKRAIGSLPDINAEFLPQRSKVGDSRLTFGYIGRVTEEKGVELLARTFGRLSSLRIRFKLAGETSPQIRERLQQLAGGNPIEFMGFVTPREFYESVDVVVVPSLWPEPLPRSIIDAISYGKPVIASNRGGNAEAMGDPHFGRLFEPDDEQSLYDLMEQWDYTTTYKRISHNENPLEEYCKVYESVITSRSSQVS